MMNLGGEASYLYSTEYNDLVIRMNVQEAEGPFQIDNETLADILKPWAAFRDPQHSVALVSQSSHQPPASTTFGRLL
jgi:hypothetical protein